jgi:hypothetical protein
MIIISSLNTVTDSPRLPPCTRIIETLVHSRATPIRFVAVTAHCGSVSLERGVICSQKKGMA